MLSSDHVRERLLRNLDHVAQPEGSLVVIGGSILTDRATPTSDLDLLVVGSPELARAAVRSASWPKPVDLERREVTWLESLGQHLADYTPTATGTPSPFNLFDLRFAARTLLGRTVLGTPPQTLREPLRVALADYFSTWWGSTYQDVLGLYLAKRADEALVLVGELAQRACTVALLQLGLIDPAPKWALRQCQRHHLLVGAADRLERALCCTEPTGAWLREVLIAANHVVAVSRSAGSPHLTADPCSPPPVEWCVLGRPGLDIILDASSGQLMVYNSAVLASYCR